MNDIILKDFDLLTINGDFVVDNSYGQEVETILTLSKGHLKSDPVLGVDLLRYKNSTISKNEIIQRIRLNLERDNKRIKEIRVVNNQIIIE